MLFKKSSNLEDQRLFNIPIPPQRRMFISGFAIGTAIGIVVGNLLARLLY